jgi:hypothetical protein
MKLFLIPVGVFAFCIAVYIVAYAESEAYSTFQEFDMHRLKFRFDDAEKLVNSDQVREVLEMIRGRGYTFSRLNAGPYRKLEDEESLSDGRVKLKIAQELGRGPGSAPGTLGTVNVREHIECVMVETSDGWKVDRLTIRDEWLDGAPPEDL